MSSCPVSPCTPATRRRRASRCRAGSRRCALEIGRWLDPEIAEDAPEKLRARSWSGILRVHADGALELDAEGTGHDRTLRITELEDAARHLIPG
jgi:hypothetical protein